MTALGDWVARLSRVDLPVLRATALEFERLRAVEDLVTARELAGIMLRDPLMTVKVLRYSQSRLTSRQPTEVTTVEHAIMMHGVARFFREFQQLVTLEDVLAANPGALDGALAVLSRSYHAAVNARNFAALRHDMEGEEVTVSALLHDLTELLMWCTEPQTALQIERMVACNRGLRSASAQRAVLGFALTELQLALAQAWRLPRLLTTLMDDRHWEIPRVQTVRVSVSIARHTAHGWQDAGLPEDCRILQGLLNQPAEMARRWIRQSALQAARHWRAFGVKPAAAWLPAMPGAEPIDALRNAILDLDQAPALVAKVVAQLDAVGPSVEPRAAVALALFALEGPLNLGRVWFGVVNEKAGRVEARQHVFRQPGLGPGELAFEVGSGHLFDRLLERGQALWHAPERNDQLARLLPAGLRQKIGQAHFFAMALHPAQRPRALLYADHGDGGPLDEDRYNAFKRICLGLASALQRVRE